MIPQLQERIAKLEAISDERERMIAELRDNVSELRRQIGVDREPKCEPVLDYPAPTAIYRR